MRLGRGLWVIGLLCCGTGCGSRSASFDAPNQVRAKSLLVSEIVAAEDRKSIVSCPLEIRNTGTGQVSVKLISTGCSCYGVTLDGRPFDKGATFTLDPDDVERLNIAAAPPEIESEKEYRAAFEIREGDGEAGTFEARCLLSVYSDVTISPAVLSCLLEPGRELTGSRMLTVAHVYRGTAPRRRPPRFENLPAFAAVGEPIAAGEPEEVEPGLIREKWQVELTLSGKPPVESLEIPFAFQVVFGDGTEVPRVASDARIVVERNLPISHPSHLHLGSAVVGATTERRILMTSRTAAEFRLTIDPERLPAGFEVVVKDEPSVRHWITVRFTPPVSGDVKEKLILETNRPDQPTIEIAVEARVREPAGSSVSPDRSDLPSSTPGAGANNSPAATGF